jgi:hypothetical protein
MHGAYNAWGVRMMETGGQAGSDSRGAEEFLLHEYDYYGEAFRQNEELGEKRVTSFLTLAVVVATGLGLVLGDGGVGRFKGALGLVAMASTVVLVFGQMTLARLVRRNLVSDGYKDAMALVRAWFVRQDPRLKEYLYHAPDDEPRRREISLFKLASGGWLETMIVANGVFSGVAASAIAAAACEWTNQAGRITWIVASSTGLVIAVLTLVVNARRAAAQYARDRSKYLRRSQGPLVKNPVRK